MRIFETIKVFPMVIIPSLAIVARDAAATAVVHYWAWAGAAIGAIGVTFTLNIAFAIKCPRRTVRAEHRADRAEIVVGALQCPGRLFPVLVTIVRVAWTSARMDPARQPARVIWDTRHSTIAAIGAIGANRTGWGNVNSRDRAI